MEWEWAELYFGDGPPTEVKRTRVTSRLLSSSNLTCIEFARTSTGNVLGGFFAGLGIGSVPGMIAALADDSSGLEQPDWLAPAALFAAGGAIAGAIIGWLFVGPDIGTPTDTCIGYSPRRQDRRLDHGAQQVSEGPQEVLPHAAPSLTRVETASHERSTPSPRMKAPPTCSVPAVLFSFGSAGVAQARVMETIRQLAAIVRTDDSISVLLVGHTDSAGPPVLNDQLSTDRAEAVRRHLIIEGISPVRVRTVGVGARKPIASNATEAGRSLNRRVEISLAFSGEDGVAEIPCHGP